MKFKTKLLILLAIFSLSSCQGGASASSSSLSSSYQSNISFQSSNSSQISVLSLPNASSQSNSSSSKSSSTPIVSTATDCSTSYTYKNIGIPMSINESSFYNTKETVALYIRTFHKLSGNYITKEQNEAGNYDNNTYDIGGNNFTNGQGILPYSSQYIECDIDGTLKPSGRGIKRIVFSKISWRIFYTSDHYATFEEYLGYNNWGKKFGGNNGKYITPCTIEPGYTL